MSEPAPTPTEPAPEMAAPTPTEPAPEMAAEEASPPEAAPLCTHAFGIDFGTTACVTACHEAGGKIGLVHDEEFSKEMTRSLVSFAGNRRLVGEAAESQLRSNISNTAVEIPRLLGLPQSDEYPASRHTVADGAIEVSYDDATVSLRPEQLTAALFTKLKADILKKHPQSFDTCIIAVPGSFSSQQRRGVLDAAKIAGLPVSRLVTASTAAAYSFASRHPDAEAPALIVDVGSGYASATLLQMQEGEAVVLAAESSDKCGCREVDMALFGMVAEECMSRLQVEVKINTALGQRLLKQCEGTKKVLSTVGQADLFLEGVKGDQDASFPISRATLAEKCKTFTEALGKLVGGVAGQLPEGVTLGSIEVIGGGSCIPMVQEAVGPAAGGLPLGHTMDLTSAVGYGAAMAAWAAVGGAGAPRVKDSSPWDDGVEAEAGLGEAALEEAVAWEAKVEAKESSIKAVEQARNDMEKLVYEMRAECTGRLKEHFNAEGTMAELQGLEDWIWSEEGEEADLAGCEAKLASVNAKLAELNPGYYKTLEEELVAAKLKEEEDSKRWAAEAANGPADGVNKDTRKLKFDDRMKLVMSNKAEATELFKDGNTEHAAMRYAKSLGHCDSFFDLNDTQKEEVRTIKAALYNNMAMCYLKLEKWIKAKENCRYCLEIEPQNVKALYRRAQTFVEEKNWDEADADLKRALEVAPEDKPTLRLQQVVAKGKKKEKDKAKKMCGKMFG